MKAFSSYGFTNGFIAELDRRFPSYLSAWDRGNVLRVIDEKATHFGYVHEGPAVLCWNGLQYTLPYGGFFCVPGRFEVWGGRGIVVSREDFNGVFQLGGPIEVRGRLKYIDGCTDSLLVPPVKLGDPCLNLLHFPAWIDQTAHDHHSDRIGIIMSGRGRCHHWTGGREQVVDLTAGMIFCIHTGGKHKFSTPYGDEMRVLAYHPDSDFGPTNHDHPMINRTIVNGVSASQLAEIQTR